MQHKIISVVFLILIISPFIVAENQFGNPISTESYEISRSKIDRTIRIGNILEDTVKVKNKMNVPMKVEFSVEGDVSKYITLDVSSLTIEPQNTSDFYFYIKASELGTYVGNLKLSGNAVESIPINISIVDRSLDPLLLVNLKLSKNEYLLNKKIETKVDVTRLKAQNIENATLTYNLVDITKNETTILDKENLNITESVQILKDFEMPKDSAEGYYALQIIMEYNSTELTSMSLFLAKIPFMQRKLLGIFPIWIVISFISFILLVLASIFGIKKYIASKQKYKMKLDVKTLEKEDKKNLWLGKIAERKNGAYLDPHRLTTHAIVAGATGGGKSIAAQDIIEEALKHNICVIVFDPTAQWSGMLRKCEDKKMFAYYSKFGMKPSDARGFPGNIRAVKDARQKIDVEKVFEPGHIQIFTLNKLQPKDMDIFVASVISEIFKSDPKEYPTLRTLLVFDEIHRILPKFGGSGEGFVQIERACREFRKWGYGVMLISQVLSDFAGQIKANISTEVQMRTRDEGDLNRIKTKYGEGFLQSLVKASVGVGMMVNPAYNHANPYFVNFRPILHNTRRLPDEELEKYNQYNDKVEDLEYQLEQLEELKIDVFDLKMELKLVKDKIMSGNFSVVDIYLEGIVPRIKKQWDKIGKTPKKKQIELVSLEDIKKSISEAQSASDKAKAQDAAKSAAEAESKRDILKELSEKIVQPLTFDNGAMISSFKELKQYLPIIDDETWAVHVNAQKHDIAKWLEQVSKPFAARMSSVKDKAEFIKQVNEWKGKEPTATPPKPSAAPQPKSAEQPKK